MMHGKESTPCSAQIYTPTNKCAHTKHTRAHTHAHRIHIPIHTCTHVRICMSTSICKHINVHIHTPHVHASINLTTSRTTLITSSLPPSPTMYIQSPLASSLAPSAPYLLLHLAVLELLLPHCRYSLSPRPLLLSTIACE